MLIVGLFEQSIELEQALAELEHRSISDILVVFMDHDSRKHTASTHRPQDFEIGVAFSTGCAVIGASAGFRLAWGPIIWGLIGALLGFGIGLMAYYLYHARHTRTKSESGKTTGEAVVIIQCPEDRLQSVQDLLWHYHALTVGHVDHSP